jgi:hypothetical protein
MPRLYSPLEPFFEKTCQPGEIELVRIRRMTSTAVCLVQQQPDGVGGGSRPAKARYAPEAASPSPPGGHLNT